MDIDKLTAGVVAVGPLNWEKKGDQYSLTYFFNAKLADYITAVPIEACQPRSLRVQSKQRARERTCLR